MCDEEREEIERLLDNLDAPQLEDGSRVVALPCGARLCILLPEDSPDLYAEAAAGDLPADGSNAARFRDLASMNFFWRQLEGFTAALRDDTLMAEAREDLARLGDEETFRTWLMRADAAVRTIREVLSATYPAEEPAESSDGELSEYEEEGSVFQRAYEGVLWP